MFVEIAPGYEATNRKGVQLVMKLKKSLYVLAQSLQNWWKTIDPSLVEIGSIPLKSDTCVYTYNHNNTVIILTLYVDDLLIIGGNIQVIETIKKKLMGKFKITDMGDVSLVLGIQVTCNRERGTLTITQENYTKSSQHSRLRLRAIGGAAGGVAPQRQGQATLPGKSHCHVDHGDRPRCCGTGDEGGDILHQHDDGAGIRI